MAIAYIIFIEFARPNQISVTLAPSIYIENSITIENYIFENKGIPCVIAGTSMSKVLDRSQIIDNNIFADIAFWGANPTMGIHLVARAPKRPKIIMIEIGLGLSNSDGDLKTIDSVFDVPSYWFKKFMPAFRTKFQPGTVIISYLRSRFTPLQFYKKEESLDSRDPNTYNFIMGMLKNKYADIPEGRIDTILTTISQMVRPLEKEGIKIILFEMPLNKELTQLNSYKLIMKKARAQFPEDRYQWINRPDEAGYQTSDGVHLMWSSASKYYKYICEQPTIKDLIGEYPRK